MSTLDALLAEAEGRVAPNVAALVLQDGAVRYARAPDRVFDLASLTKPLCTAELAMRAISNGRIGLEDHHPILPPGVTVRHLLQHSSGWPAHERFYTRCADRAALVAAVLATPPEAAPGARHRYSDLGFIALGEVLAAVGVDDAGGMPLDALFARAWPDGALRFGMATVDDDNARVMGGVAGHAGLFGSANAVGAAAMRWLRGDVPLAARAFVERGPGTHALGWDTANADGTSTAGANPPPDTVGHLGFTGTSLWFSPSTRRVSVLLTDRVAYGVDPAPIRALRRAFHGAAWVG